jgi:hypothetical protein
MPIWKFREGKDTRPVWTVPPGHPDLIRRIRAVWAISARLTPPNFPRGVRKYRTIEEAGKDRDAWNQQRIERLRKEHQGTNPPGE